MSQLTQLTLRQFTAFDQVSIDFSPGLNVFVGKNGTGKTHLLKVLYSACRARRDVLGEEFGDKLIGNFMPFEGRVGRLVRRQPGRSTASIKVYSAPSWIEAEFSSHGRRGGDVTVQRSKTWHERDLTTTFIPVKEMLAHAAGFGSLWRAREISFEELYVDLIDAALLPPRRGRPDAKRNRLLEALEASMAGRVVLEGEQFFLKNRQGKLEFSLLAEGLRKLALLSQLINNGTLSKGSILFWDEPEANLNPSLQGSVVHAMLELTRAGVQVFLTTHSYVLLKEIDLRAARDRHGQLKDDVLYHTLDRPDSRGPVAVKTTDRFESIEPNALRETFLDLYDREIARAATGNGG